MVVILMKDVKGTGKAGDVVKVSDGYARNMLLPKGLAKEATEGNIRSLEKQKAIAAEKLEEQKAAAKEMADTLANITLKIQGRRFRQAVRFHHFQGYRGSAGEAGRHEDRQEKDRNEEPDQTGGRDGSDAEAVHRDLRTAEGIGYDSIRKKSPEAILQTEGIVYGRKSTSTQCGGREICTGGCHAFQGCTF